MAAGAALVNAVAVGVDVQDLVATGWAMGKKALAGRGERGTAVAARVGRAFVIREDRLGGVAELAVVVEGAKRVERGFA